MKQNKTILMSKKNVRKAYSFGGWVLISIHALTKDSDEAKERSTDNPLL